MNIILFGPPGMGKSTVIGHLKTLGVRAIDLEDLYPNKIRFQMPNLAKNVVLGGADLSPRRLYPDTKKVLLYADQKIYDERRLRRDAKDPVKAHQAVQNPADWLKGIKYDEIIDTTNLTPLETASKVKEIMEK